MPGDTFLKRVLVIEVVRDRVFVSADSGDVDVRHPSGHPGHGCMPTPATVGGGIGNGYSGRWEFRISSTSELNVEAAFGVC